MQGMRSGRALAALGELRAEAAGRAAHPTALALTVRGPEVMPGFAMTSENINEPPTGGPQSGTEATSAELVDGKDSVTVSVAPGTSAFGRKRRAGTWEGPEGLMEGSAVQIYNIRKCS